MMSKPTNDISKKMDELIKLETAVRNLLVLYLGQSKVPHKAIAKAAGIQTKRLYQIIPKGKKSKPRKKKQGKA